VARSVAFARLRDDWELTIEYLKPVDVMKEIEVEGRETEQKGRIFS